MRILHIVHQYPPEYVGGTELYTQTLARHQAGSMGHEVAVIHPSLRVAEAGASPFLPEIEPGGVRVYRVPLGERTPRQRFLATLREPDVAGAVNAVLAAERPDVVHVQHLMGLPARTVAQAAAAGAAVVITLHDYWFPCANAQLLTNYDETICDGPALWINCGRCALARAGHDLPALAPVMAPLMALRARLVGQALRRADRIIAPTHFVRETYQDLGMSGKGISVIPHGINIPRRVAKAPRQPRPLHPGTLHVVYVGGISPQKGIHVLIDAINLLPADAVRLTIYGDLDKFPEYVTSLRQSATHPGIAFGGRIARDALWSMLLEEADVGIVPTMWYETSSLVVQEMFAAGVPVVASRIGALPEKVRDGVDGLLFPVGDATALAMTLRQLLAEPERFRALQQGIKPARRLEDHARDIAAVYEAVLP